MGKQILRMRYLATRQKRLMDGILRISPPVTGTCTINLSIRVIPGLPLGTMPLWSARFSSGMRGQQTQMWTRHAQRLKRATCFLAGLYS